MMKLLTRFRLWFKHRNWLIQKNHDYALRIALLYSENLELLSQVEECRQYEPELRLAQMANEANTAQLMQLRVHGMTGGKGQTGYGVTCFIPEETLALLRKHESKYWDFVHYVAEDLVGRAVGGLWFQSTRHYVSAMTFQGPALNQPVQPLAITTEMASTAPRIPAKT